MEFIPYILGRGRAGEALAKSFEIVRILEPQWALSAPQFLPRDLSWNSLHNPSQSFLVLANPPGLHLRCLEEAKAPQWAAVFVEKPACVSLEEVQKMRALNIPRAAVLHGYREMWGPQTLKQWIDSGYLGELIQIESRYWQPSTAHRALFPSDQKSWKDDTRLGGTSDALLDLGTHWLDLCNFLVGENTESLNILKRFDLCEAPHRDTHLNITANYKNKLRALGSISKIIHGSTNQLEITLMGTKKTVTWRFMSPDEIEVGEGRNRSFVTRQNAELGTQAPPHHGAGWLEGYVEIIKKVLRNIFEGTKDLQYPHMNEHLKIVEALLEHTLRTP